MKKIPLYFGLLIVFGPCGQSIQALTINQNPALNGDASVSTDISTNEGDARGEVDLDIKENSTSTAGESINSERNIGVTENIKVEREDVNNESEATLITAESVTTNADLMLYAKSILLSDPNVDKVIFEKDQVKIGYKKQGKIFGLFKVKYNIETEVTGDGEIEVHYPWYASLTSGNNKSQVRERMEKDVSEFLDKNTNASGEIELYASVEAKLANLIHTILVEELAGGISADDQNKN